MAAAPAPGPIVLVTNDDGVAAPGIRALVRALCGKGCRVMVSAHLFLFPGHAGKRRHTARPCADLVGLGGGAAR